MRGDEGDEVHKKLHNMPMCTHHDPRVVVAECLPACWISRSLGYVRMQARRNEASPFGKYGAPLPWI